MAAPASGAILPTVQIQACWQQPAGPGVCVLAREVRPGEHTLVEVLSAHNDALEVAKNFLKHPRSDTACYFVILLPITGRAERTQVAAELAPFCGK
jgi:hypothetical protein